MFRVSQSKGQGRAHADHGYELASFDLDTKGPALTQGSLAKPPTLLCSPTDLYEHLLSASTVLGTGDRQ